jgi:hypothetical protein
MKHQAQIARIQEKLVAAKQADPQFNVFGASSHKYQMAPPVTEADIRQFETSYSIVLPDCFREFLLGVGNGGAGPFYGIYPLGSLVNELVEDPRPFLMKPAIIDPDMTDAVWKDLKKQTSESGLSDEEFNEVCGKLYSGVLPIGSQGCSYLHAIVLNGPCQGQVVNLDVELQKPCFTFEKTFLDWYERWLDEVISGILLQTGPMWFGYTMGGSDDELMRAFEESGSLRIKKGALSGLSKLQTVNCRTLQRLLELSKVQDQETRHQALAMLTKFSYEMAVDALRMHMLGNDADCLAACQDIHWFAKERSRDWFELLRERLHNVEDEEMFRFMTYLLIGSTLDFSENLKPFCLHSNEKIRSQAFYALGNLPDKSVAVDLFVIGMRDASPQVIHTVLQAAKGLRDPRLIEPCKHVLDRFKTNEEHILTNLKILLEAMGYASLEDFRRNTQEMTGPYSKWRAFWKRWF